MKGYVEAAKYKVDEVAVFTAATDAFTQKNINCSIKESLERFKDVIDSAKRDHVRVRGYVSCVLGCPYQGDVDPKQAAQVSKDLLDLGCDEVSLGDTIGVGTPAATTKMLSAVISGGCPADKLAVHFHDTYGQALANILSALQMGISVVDSSISGLGGCPYALGASGNVATEDVLYLMNGLGIDTGVDMDKLVQVTEFLAEILPHRPVASKAGIAKLNKMRRDRRRTLSKQMNVLPPVPMPFSPKNFT
jgi:hydroxymethylglutaryl-CoA lyase